MLTSGGVQCKCAISAKAYLRHITQIGSFWPPFQVQTNQPSDLSLVRRFGQSRLLAREKLSALSSQLLLSLISFIRMHSLRLVLLLSHTSSTCTKRLINTAGEDQEEEASPLFSELTQ